MSVAKFADEAKLLTNLGDTWCCHMHKRSTDTGKVEQSTAVVLFPARAKLRYLPHITAAHRRFARRLSFGKAVDGRAQVLLDQLRTESGAVHWRSRWAPRLRKFMGIAVFDTMLLARALSCVPGSRGRVTVEVARIDRGGHMVRVIGKGWRILIAGRLDADAKPFAALPTGSVAPSKGTP